VNNTTFLQIVLTTLGTITQIELSTLDTLLKIVVTALSIYLVWIQIKNHRDRDE
jgi:hypothetical protein